MRIGRRVVGIGVIGGALAASCGSDSTNNPFSGSDAGDASVANGGASSGGSTSGSGGSAGLGMGGSTAGDGGAATGGSAAGGVTASGGSAGAPNDCVPPADKKQTSLCVTLVPERITAESDPGLDKKGTMVVQVFDTSTPPDKNASAIALAERVLPANPGTSEVAIDNIAMQRLVGTFPAVVYVRAIFVDDSTRLAPGATLGPGAWIGGINLNDGLQDKDPVLPVDVKVGQGNAIDLPLVALRKLTVKVHASATPVGDGQGPLAALVVNSAEPAKKPPLFGAATSACADITSDVTLTGFVVGKGPYWVTGALNDLGLPGDFPPGTLAAVDVMGNKATIPQTLTFKADAYAVSTSIDLSYAVPWPMDAGPLPPNSCADLAKTDGGLPDGGR
jgi:hypothetical protein